MNNIIAVLHLKWANDSNFYLMKEKTWDCECYCYIVWLAKIHVHHWSGVREALVFFKVAA